MGAVSFYNLRSKCAECFLGVGFNGGGAIDRRFKTNISGRIYLSIICSVAVVNGMRGKSELNELSYMKHGYGGGRWGMRVGQGVCIGEQCTPGC